MVDIAIPVSTYNEPELLERCLHALTRQRNQGFDLQIADEIFKYKKRFLLDSYRVLLR